MNSPYRRQFFVCTSGKTCPTQGSEAVHAALKDAVFAAGFGDERCGKQQHAQQDEFGLHE